jgi:hypothetical protein
MGRRVYNPAVAMLERPAPGDIRAGARVHDA